MGIDGYLSLHVPAHWVVFLLFPAYPRAMVLPWTALRIPYRGHLAKESPKSDSITVRPLARHGPAANLAFS